MKKFRIFYYPLNFEDSRVSILKIDFLLKLVFEVIFVVTLDFGFGYSTTPRDGWV